MACTHIQSWRSKTRDLFFIDSCVLQTVLHLAKQCLWEHCTVVILETRYAAVKVPAFPWRCFLLCGVTGVTTALSCNSGKYVSSADDLLSWVEFYFKGRISMPFIQGCSTVPNEFPDEIFLFWLKDLVGNMLQSVWKSHFVFAFWNMSRK